MNFNPVTSPRTHPVADSDGISRGVPPILQQTIRAKKMKNKVSVSKNQTSKPDCTIRNIDIFYPIFRQVQLPTSFPGAGNEAGTVARADIFS